MKKIALIIAAVMVSSAMAMAETYNGTITWLAGAGVYNHASTSSSFADFSTDGILVQYDVLWQLIHTLDGNTHTPDPVTWNSDFLQDGKEELVDFRWGNAADFDAAYGADVSLYREAEGYDPLTSPLTVDSTQAYYVYQRVYELAPGASAPAKGDYYWDSGVENVTPQFDGKVNNAKILVEYDGQTTWETPVKPNLVVGVPEPATMSLLGLGALAMVLRRKLRK